MWASPLGSLLHQSQQRRVIIGESASKAVVIILFEEITDVKSYHLCCILLAKKQITGHIQGEKITQKCELPPEPQMGTQREGWEFLMHLYCQLIHLSLLLSKYFQLSNYPYTRSMSISNTGSNTTYERSPHLDTNGILRSQFKRCGEAGH